MKDIVLESEITCPNCGHKKVEMMPTNACQWYYPCEQCQQLLTPKAGDCCVYCSYGTVPCPPIQQNPANKGCCAS
ncbi:GDCCVxC domain-containing (seleno)protein [Agarivorans sp. MS3-6]